MIKLFKIFSFHAFVDLLSVKLPSVPEECVAEDIFRGRALANEGYLDLDPLSLEQQTSQVQQQQQLQQQQQQQLQQQLQQQPRPPQQAQQASSPLQYTATIFAQAQNEAFRPSGSSAFQQGLLVHILYYLMSIYPDNFPRVKTQEKKISL